LLSDYPIKGGEGSYQKGKTKEDFLPQQRLADILTQTSFVTLMLALC
jgi:hypothetical protein